MHVKSLQLCLNLCNPMEYSPPSSSVHGIFQARNTGVGCHALLREIFPTQGSNPRILHCRWILHCWAIREAHVVWLFPRWWEKEEKKKPRREIRSRGCLTALRVTWGLALGVRDDLRILFFWVADINRGHRHNGIMMVSRQTWWLLTALWAWVLWRKKALHKSSRVLSLSFHSW